jgi:predicted N-acetyltransferase YhbS
MLIKSHKKGSAKTYLAIDENNQSIMGYCTLSPASIAYQRTPEIVKRGLARREVPAFRLGRLTVDLAFQGERLGGYSCGTALIIGGDSG